MATTYSVYQYFLNIQSTSISSQCLININILSMFTQSCEAVHYSRSSHQYLNNSHSTSMCIQCSFNFLFRTRWKCIEKILMSWDCLWDFIEKILMNWDFVEKQLIRCWGNIEVEKRLIFCWEFVERMLNFTQCSLWSQQVKEHPSRIDPDRRPS